MKHQLSFRDDGHFRIVQFTDLHWMDGREEDQKTRILMQNIISAEQPDLVVFTGDLIYTGPVSPGNTECNDPRQSFRDAVAAVELTGTPWAFVFGNHDTEKYISRDELMNVALEQQYNVAEPGPDELPGSGNYVLEIMDAEGNMAAHLYFLDSGSYSSQPQVPGYDWIKPSQINWLMQESAKRNAQRKEKLPALAFFHIPIPEYQHMWETETCYGYKNEAVCSPQINSGLFSALLEIGDVSGTFCGHDHINDYTGLLHGIQLSYGRATGYNTYGKEGFPRGARIIQLRVGQKHFETWLRLEDGSVIHQQPEHTPSACLVASKE
ncbi:metallophosphoesterase family protein [Neobacillus mesonae]|nr:metallophosphoesterase family protein [Neobacillus mesonae]